PLVGVALAGEGKRPLDRVGVDRPHSIVAVRGDHREEIAEQGALVVGERGGSLAVEGRWRPGHGSRANAGVSLTVGWGLVVLGTGPRRAADPDLSSRPP